MSLLKYICFISIVTYESYNSSLSPYTHLLCTQQFDYDVSSCGSLRGHGHGVCWTSWMFMFMSFTKFGKFLATISSNLSFILFSSSWIPTRHMLVYLMVYHRFPKLFTFPQKYSSEIIISFVLSSSSPALYSTYENLIVKPASEFFIALTVLFSSRNFFVPFYVFSHIIGISVFPYVIFLSSSSSSLVLWASLEHLS